MTFIIIDTSGVVSFVKASSRYEAMSYARDNGIKPFIVKQI